MDEDNQMRQRGERERERLSGESLKFFLTLFQTLPKPFMAEDRTNDGRPSSADDEHYLKFVSKVRGQ